MKKVFSKYITRNGRRIYKKDGGVFVFLVDDTKNDTLSYKKKSIV